MNHVAAPDRLLGQAQALAENLASLPPVHLQETKQLLRRIRPQPTSEVRALEREIRDRVAKLDDTRESMRAWVERRPPSYQGR